MTNSIHNAYVSEGAQKIMDIWEANRVANQYHLARTKNNGLIADTLVKSTSTDGKDDGKISFKEKIQNFGKGLTAPIRTMLASPKNFLITVGSVVAGAAIIAATGGAAAPVFVAAGLIGGGVKIGKGIYQQAKAKTDEEAKQAWQKIGTGTFTVGVSAAGAKTAAKAAHIEGAQNMSTLQASIKCITNLPKCINQSILKLMPKTAAATAAAETASATETASAAAERTPAAEPVSAETAEVHTDSAAAPKTETVVPPKQSEVIETEFVEAAPEPTPAAAEVHTDSAIVPQSKTVTPPKQSEVIETEFVETPSEPIVTETPAASGDSAIPSEPIVTERPKLADTPVTGDTAADAATRKGLITKIIDLLKVFGIFKAQNKN